jgi:hypothetical protein
MGSALTVEFLWTVYEWQRKGHLFVKTPVLRRKNLQTNYGLTAYAGAFQPGQSSYVAPQWMGISTNYAQLQSTYGSTGVTSVSTDVDPTKAGDTQLILGVGTANQETVTFSGKTGTGPYTWTISATTKTHALHDPVVRVPLAADTLSQFTGEIQYDSTNFPNQRMQSVGGYSASSANWTTQFFFTGNQALVTFALVGLFDSATVAGGNLHNELALGYVHTVGNDAEVDVSLTLSNV